MVEWGDVGGVLSLASGILVWGFQEPVGCDWNFQLFPIQTRDSLHLCVLFWSGSGDSQPLLGALGYPSWVLLFHCLRTLPDLGPAYLCGPCYWKASNVEYQFFTNCFPRDDSSFLIWALCSRSVFFPVLLRQWEENLKFVWWDSCFRIDSFDWAKIETSVLTAVLQPLKRYSLLIFFHAWYGKVSASHTLLFILLTRRTLLKCRFRFHGSGLGPETLHLNRFLGDARSRTTVWVASGWAT